MLWEKRGWVMHHASCLGSHALAVLPAPLISRDDCGRHLLRWFYFSRLVCWYRTSAHVAGPRALPLGCDTEDPWHMMSREYQRKDVFLDQTLLQCIGGAKDCCAPL